MSRARLITRLAKEWHTASDHAADGATWGGPMCNCRNVATRIVDLGWPSRFWGEGYREGAEDNRESYGRKVRWGITANPYPPKATT